MKAILANGLNQNVAHWSELSLAMKWIQQTVTILDNEEQLPRLFVQQRFGAWMIFMSDHKTQLGSLADSISHLLKITRSYWSGLFHCYQVEHLPKTNNDLEQVFGSFRHHTRRTTGRKKAPASILIRGSSRAYCSSSYSPQNFHRQRFSYGRLGCLATSTFTLGITSTDTSSTTSFSP